MSTSDEQSNLSMECNCYCPCMTVKIKKDPGLACKDAQYTGVVADFAGDDLEMNIMGGQEVVLGRL